MHSQAAVFWGGMWWCISSMVGVRGGSATDDRVKAVDGVVRQMTRGSWATAFGDMRRCCQRKGVGATGGVVGGRHALVGHDKQQSTKGEREGGVKLLTRWLVLCACSPEEDGGELWCLARVGVGLLTHWVPRAKMGGGQCHLLCFVWFAPSNKKSAMLGPEVIDIRSFLSDVE